MLTRMAPLLTRMARMARLLTRMARMLTRMTRWLAGSHIIHTPQGLAKKTFSTEVKCRKCPAKEKCGEEGSKTYWAILSFPHA